MVNSPSVSRCVYIYLGHPPDEGTWDTSRAYVRRTLEKCIELGRRYRNSDEPRREDKYESFRLLGAAVSPSSLFVTREWTQGRLDFRGKLHTLEDYPAHSNFCELCLVSMGHTKVFTHVGDAVRIRAPDGRMVTPVVTGRYIPCTAIPLVSEGMDVIGVFGADDFMHSLFSG